MDGRLRRREFLVTGTALAAWSAGCMQTEQGDEEPPAAGSDDGPSGLPTETEEPIEVGESDGTGEPDDTDDTDDEGEETDDAEEGADDEEEDDGGPEVSIDASLASEEVPNGYVFEADATEGGEPITAYRWDLGDGTEAEGESVSHAYVDPDEYTVEVTVEDEAGATESGSETVTVDERPDGRPITGEFFAELVGIDEALLELLDSHDVGGATVAVNYGGEFVHSRGYGWRDREREEAVAPDALMRIASVTKPITAAAIRRLDSEGEIDLDEPALDLIDVEPRGDDPDDQLAEVTVGHLLDHQGGWDRDATFDPLFQPVEIAEELDLDRPPEPREIAEFTLGRPLQFDPGTQRVYSNFGYLLLGLLIEDVTGESYDEYVREAVLDPVGAEEVYPARNLPEDRPDDEVAYDDGRSCYNAVELDRDDGVTCADGGIDVEAMDAAAGLVASAPAVARFTAAYELDGTERSGAPSQRRTTHGWFTDGTSAVARQGPDEIDVVVLCNSRVPTEELDDAIDAAIDRVEWP
jgi:CubicO group peptidase (beta-lactamase class C family)